MKSWQAKHHTMLRKDSLPQSDNVWRYYVRDKHGGILKEGGTAVEELSHMDISMIVAWVSEMNKSIYDIDTASVISDREFTFIDVIGNSVTYKLEPR